MQLCMLKVLEIGKLLCVNTFLFFCADFKYGFSKDFIQSL